MIDQRPSNPIALLQKIADAERKRVDKIRRPVTPWWVIMPQRQNAMINYRSSMHSLYGDVLAQWRMLNGR